MGRVSQPGSIGGLLWALAWALLWAGSSQAQAQQEPGPLERVRTRGKLIVATDATYPPFENIDSEGNVVGFDIDLAREIARDLGVELELKVVEWDSIIGELQTGNVDMILSGMSVTEERKQAIRFSDPYYSVDQVVLLRKDETRFESWRDLDAPGVVVATQLGTTGAKAIKEKLPQAQLKPFGRAQEACQALTQGGADAVVFDHPFLQEYAALQAQSVRGLWDPFASEPIAAAVRKGEGELARAVNTTLARLAASGGYRDLTGRWFPRASDSPPPPDLTIEDEAPSSSGYAWNWTRFFGQGWWLQILSGLGLTLAVALCGILVALPLGVLIGLGRTASGFVPRAVALVYVEVFRGTPLLVQMYIWYFVIAKALGLTSFLAAVGALGGFAAAYIAEIVRAGIQSIDHGQVEAARSLGLSHAETMRFVVLPQAITRILPPLASEFVALVKDSSLASVVALHELTLATRQVATGSYLTFEPWLFTAVIYLTITVTLSFGVRLIEVALGQGTRREAIR